jgi:hypothetical protein
MVLFRHLGDDSSSLISSDHRSGSELPGRSWEKFAFVLILSLGVFHVVATWGRLDVFIWRDAGRWLSEVERFAGGGTLYRDFTWQYPPLPIWILGGVARLFGSSAQVIWAATAIVYLGILIGFFRYARLLVPGLRLLLVLFAGFLFSAAFANYLSAALPLGMYAPGAPVGFLCLIFAAGCVLRLLVSPSHPEALIAGAWCGLCILAKQDFWLAALYLVFAGGLCMALAHGRAGSWTAGLLVGSFGLTCAAGAALIGISAGWSRIPPILTGYGSAAIFRTRGFPTWDRLLLEVAALSLLAFLVAPHLAFQKRESRSMPPWRSVLLLLAAVSLTGFIVMTYRQTRSVSDDIRVLTMGSLWHLLRFTAERALLHILPFVLPIAALILMALRWNRIPNPPVRNLLAFLLGFCLMARVRRGFEFTEWFNFLLEMPAYGMAALLLHQTNESSKRLRIGAVATVSLALFSYWYFGVGVLTRHGSMQPLTTAKGTVFVTPEVARDYHTVAGLLSRRDPSRSRPLFAFGYADAFSYFLGRPSASSQTAGFWNCDLAPDAVVHSVLAHQPPPFLMDVERYRSNWPRSGLFLDRWAPPNGAGDV